MTEEKTLDELRSESEKLDKDIIKRLDDYNPVENVASTLHKEIVRVTGVEVPPPESIVFAKNPSIEIDIKLQSGDKVSVSILLDKFSEDSKRYDMRMSDFIRSLNIERQEFGSLIGSEIPVMVRRNGSDYSVKPANTERGQIVGATGERESTTDEVQVLENLWSAQEYGKARIVSVKRERCSNRMSIEIEIPWVSSTKVLYFDNKPGSSEYYDSDQYPINLGKIFGKKDYPFIPFFESVKGRKPLSKSDLSSIVGEEIEIDYEGKVRISESLDSQMRENERDFTEYLKDNISDFIGLNVNNYIFVSLIGLIPPFIILPIYLFSVMSGSSIYIGAFAVLFLFLVVSVVISTLESYKSYREDDKIDF